MKSKSRTRRASEAGGCAVASPGPESRLDASESDRRPIELRGCRVNNLQDIDVDIPRGKLVVVCGLSGSGKTSLALDTLYAEGQRCYIESFSAYTRQYLARLEKPDCDSITGIPPAIAVTRAAAVKNNRSTVATATEIAEHIRLLFAKAGDLSCYRCGRKVEIDSPQSVAAEMTDASMGVGRSVVGFEVELPDRTAAGEILLGLQQEGYLRLILKGETFQLSDEDRRPLARRIGSRGATAIVVVDRLTGQTEQTRWTESLETAMAEGNGRAVVIYEPTATETTTGDANADRAPRLVSIDGREMVQRIVSDRRRCDECDLEFPDPVPRLFNFNHPLGACPTCEGFGDVLEVDMSRVVPDPSLSLREGAIAPWNTPSYSHELDELLALADDYGIRVDVPFSKLKKSELKKIHRGVPERNFGGLDGFFAWLDRKKYKMHIRVFASRYRSYSKCPTCHGKRLKPEALSYQIEGRNVADVLAMRCDQLDAFLSRLGDESDVTPASRLVDETEDWTLAMVAESHDRRQYAIASEPARQIRDRLRFMDAVGLGYLQLNRPLRTLSGGETQRIALTSALGSTLIGMLYVLDEPTAGLHPDDVTNLIRTIIELRDRGNTVVAVEHNAQLIAAADHVIEIGPEAGVGGGRITFVGTPEELKDDSESVTGEYLCNELEDLSGRRSAREPSGFVKLSGASGHNLKNVDVSFPLGTLCVVTGRSGSGKSSLIHDTLFGAVSTRLSHRRGETISADAAQTLPYKSLEGVERLEDCLLVDQSPISRSPRSCPVTFAKAFDEIRKAFAETVDAKIRNFKPGHFSFNSAAGQCTACEGAGVQTVDMQFLADVSMRCPECRGRRYREEVLQIRYRDRTIADVLEMTVGEAYRFFRTMPKVQSRLKRLIDVGLEYIHLGQPATTLSSGEAQRLKLAAFLAGSSRRRTLFLMDEPTTGLHFADVERLIGCFDALIADGHSLIVIEHHPMLVAAADWIVEVGPGAADEGGTIVRSERVTHRK
ncbi:excinuclease ABC subunit UvrA [Aporhodopirellula aestuarii]|uniref:UvrABC system protein A n=1 Tax=Aporhodopirellula aestuarii TaxID=2950107 RepID=A0ABT0UC81_9BACT|nr:excinuclease ABC subunit UvrA [Aporhodopirellula aestuarii]MCM2374391.1 excinuclease ABC subunit UvrA [Aporhodopirellula aestuarii]